MLFESLLIAVGAGATRTIGRNGTLKLSGTTKRNGMQMRALRVGGGSVAVTCVAPSAPVRVHSERAQAAGLLTDTTTARCYCPEPVLVKATTHTAKTTEEQSPRFVFPFLIQMRRYKRCFPLPSTRSSCGTLIVLTARPPRPVPPPPPPLAPACRDEIRTRT